MKRERGKAEASAAPEGTSAAAAGSRGSEWWEAIPIPHTIARRGRETGSGSTGDGEEQGRKVYTRDARRPTDGYSTIVAVRLLQRRLLPWALLVFSEFWLVGKEKYYLLGKKSIICSLKNTVKVVPR
jgi:hypothetical protein